jgi:hypothetical protein
VKGDAVKKRDSRSLTELTSPGKRNHARHARNENRNAALFGGGRFGARWRDRVTSTIAFRGIRNEVRKPRGGVKFGAVLEKSSAKRRRGASGRSQPNYCELPRASGRDFRFTRICKYWRQ